MTEHTPPPPPPPPPPTPGTEPPLGGVSTPTKEERNWAMVAHIGTLAGALVVMPFLVPLVIWLVKKEESEFIADQAKESLNFQITLYIGYIIGGVLSLVCIGVVILAVLVIAHIVLCILAGMKAAEGVRYRYPWTLRLVT